MLAIRPFKPEDPDVPGSSPGDIRNLPRLQYEKLPEGNFFRVLKTIHINATCVRCSLSVASLQNPPSYLALSYTWGSARQRDGLTTEQTKTIICNDSAALVTENLWNALRALHSGAGYLWADSLCINQDDLEELATQVTKMGQIYSKAYMVVVWLGSADRAAHIAAQTIEDFCKRYMKFEKVSGMIGDTSFWKEMGREPFTDREATALVHFYGRVWFERMWVLQEVILATHIRVVCGTMSVEWDDLVMMSIFLYNSGYARAWHELWSKILNNPNLRPLAVAPMQMDKIRRSCRSGILLAEDVIVKRENLQDLNRDQAFCKFLTLMIQASRTYYCGRPSDKVFAPLSLALHQFTGIIGSAMITPDYSKPIERIYTEVTTLIIEKTSELQLFSAVEDESLRSELCLPSWVPNFSIMESNPLEGLEFGPEFDVMKGQDTPCSVTIAGSQLTVRGYWIDTVLVAGPHHDALSNLYTFRVSPTPFLEFAHSMGERYRNGEDAVQAFIRTFTADQLPHDQLEDIKLIFNAYVRYNCFGSKDMHDLFDDVERITGLRSTSEILTALYENPQSLPSWPVLDAFESRNVAYSACPRFRDVIAWCKAMADKTYDDEEDREFIEMARHLVAECHLEAISYRRLFKGRLGYIGLAPRSARIGDELWILPGCKRPCTLRPTEMKGVYRLLGEAYVHGIMYGEFWKEELPLDPCFITLQ